MLMLWNVPALLASKPPTTRAASAMPDNATKVQTTASGTSREPILHHAIGWIYDDCTSNRCAHKIKRELATKLARLLVRYLENRVSRLAVAFGS